MKKGPIKGPFFCYCEFASMAASHGKAATGYGGSVIKLCISSSHRPLHCHPLGNHQNPQSYFDRH